MLTGPQKLAFNLFPELFQIPVAVKVETHLLILNLRSSPWRTAGSYWGATWAPLGKGHTGLKAQCLSSHPRKFSPVTFKHNSQGLPAAFSTNWTCFELQCSALFAFKSPQCSELALARHSPWSSFLLLSNKAHSSSLMRLPIQRGIHKSVSKLAILFHWWHRRLRLGREFTGPSFELMSSFIWCHIQAVVTAQWTSRTAFKCMIHCWKCAWKSNV